jgi:quercetin dioxygenase-like cupin family protein
MKCFRLYAGDDGESHFERTEIEFTPNLYAPPAPPFDVSEPVGATRYVMVRFPAGWDSELHRSPRRQLFIVLSGELEGAASDGSNIILTAGDVLLMEDTTGKGHGATVKGGDDVFALMVHLE